MKMSKKQFDTMIAKIGPAMYVMICNFPPPGFDIEMLKVYWALCEFDKANDLIVDFLNKNQKEV